MKDIKQLIEAKAKEYIDYIESESKEPLGQYTKKTLSLLFSYGADFILSLWHDAEEWRSVEDELPEKNKRVNVMLKDGTYSNSFILADGFWAYNLEPTHWKPIIS